MEFSFSSFWIDLKAFHNFITAYTPQSWRTAEPIHSSLRHEEIIQCHVAFLGEKCRWLHNQDNFLVILIHQRIEECSFDVNDCTSLLMTGCCPNGQPKGCGISTASKILFRTLFKFIVSANHPMYFAFAAIGASFDRENQFWGYDLHSAAFLSSLLLNLLQFFSCDLFQNFFLLQKIVNFGIDGFKPTFPTFGNLSCWDYVRLENLILLIWFFPLFFSFSLPIRILPLLCQARLQPCVLFLLLLFWSTSVSAAEPFLLLSPHLSNLSP